MSSLSASLVYRVLFLTLFLCRPAHAALLLVLCIGGCVFGCVFCARKKRIARTANGQVFQQLPPLPQEQVQLLAVPPQQVAAPQFAGNSAPTGYGYYPPQNTAYEPYPPAVSHAAGDSNVSLGAYPRDPNLSSDTNALPPPPPNPNQSYTPPPGPPPQVV
ncbi:hypothetical protein B0H10DRAFT_1941509 [Mycena sp. CBHHK59/15]|nr:hypothetical protein B0H10DRAFT_1941509 [Mycena sp. CBHHK59/15]